MTINQLASKIAKIEGKRSQAKIGDVREILRILGELWYEQCEKLQFPITVSATGCIDVVLYNAGEARAKRKARRKVRA